MATSGIADVGRRPPALPPRQPGSDTDVPDLEASGENLRVVNTNPEVTPMEVDTVPNKEIIQVTKVDLDVSNNTRAHHTNEYDITDPLVYQGREDLVVRRGQQFNISVQFNRPYNPNKDDLKLVFQLGENPRTSKGTNVNLVLSDRDIPNEWGAFIKSTEGNTLLLTLMTPPTCGVGQWSLMIHVVKRDDKNVTIYRYKHRSPVYILFNPWCKDDLVYMKEDHLLKEYILNETGKIYSGSWNSISSKPWSFGQFEGNVLDCVMYLLKKSRIPDHERGNPIIVSRKMSKIVNSQDERGVLVGNWRGNYEGGTSPLDWLGSVPILEEYFITKEPVSFGQCWVFSGVLTTVCRALGIPARSVTNFASAHDTDGSITIDNHFDPSGNPIEELNGDSVWNFHVWNDVWMARPDLPPGYGGWQAIDATPQETSDGYFQTGPASLLAIKRGEVSLSYDGPFIFAEVNADFIYWMKQPDGVMTRLSVVTGKVGKRISTKRAFGRASWLEIIEGRDPDREDITHMYKFSETQNRIGILLPVVSCLFNSKLVWVNYRRQNVPLPAVTNLYGDEADKFLYYLDREWVSLTESICIPSCPEPFKETRETRCVITNTSEAFSSLQDLVDKWMADTETCNISCEDDGIRVCTGVRNCKRKIKKFSPILIIRLYEHCLHNRISTSEVMASEAVKIEDRSYKLAGITMHRELHYCAVILYMHTFYWYDGLSGRLQDIPNDLENWFPCHAVYCQQDERVKYMKMRDCYCF